MAFDEVRFPVHISDGSSGGPRFLTEVVVVDSGAERRTVSWAEERGRWNAATGVAEQADLALLASFFRARRGRARGFRWKDWADYTSHVEGDLPPAMTAQGAQRLGQGNGSATTFQLIKVYGDAGAGYVRTIRKPVAGTVQVWTGTASAPTGAAAGWTINTATGLVTFTTPPASGVWIWAGFEFDVPARFDTDELSVRMESYRLGQADVPIVELRL